MSLPRPGGYSGEKRATVGGSPKSAFAGYNPPVSSPSPYGARPKAGPGAAQQGTFNGAKGAYPGAEGLGGGEDAFDSGGVGRTASGYPVPAGGALGEGAQTANGWNQYGFSRAADTRGSMGLGPGSNMGAMGAGGPTTGVGGEGGQQRAADWHQWAPESMNPQMLNMGGNVAKNFISNNVAQYQPRMSGFWHTLKAYFAVDNRYVMKKLKSLLLPVTKKNWYRLPSEDEVKDDGRPKYERPVQDVNAPDLYLPLMSFITFVLVTGYAKGAAAAKAEDARTFSPEVLIEVMGSCVVTQFLEVGIIYLGLYLLSSPAVVLDLVAYTGYQYVGLCINMAVGVGAGKTAYYGSLLWTGLMTSYFMFKTMAHTVPTGGTSSREIMILGFGILQLVSMWWLGHSKDLS